MTESARDRIKWFETTPEKMMLAFTREKAQNDQEMFRKLQIKQGRVMECLCRELCDYPYNEPTIRFIIKMQQDLFELMKQLMEANTKRMYMGFDLEVWQEKDNESGDADTEKKIKVYDEIEKHIIERKKKIERRQRKSVVDEPPNLKHETETETRL